MTGLEGVERSRRSVLWRHERQIARPMVHESGAHRPDGVLRRHRPPSRVPVGRMRFCTPTAHPDAVGSWVIGKRDGDAWVDAGQGFIRAIHHVEQQLDTL